MWVKRYAGSPVSRSREHTEEGRRRQPSTDGWRIFAGVGYTGYWAANGWHTLGLAFGVLCVPCCYVGIRDSKPDQNKQIKIAI